MVKIWAGDREFPTLDSAIAYMGTLPPPVRLQAQELVAGSLEEMGAHFEDTVAKFWDYLESDGTMNELVTGRSGLRERFGYVKTVAGKVRDRKKKREDMLKAIAKIWKNVNLDFCTTYGDIALSMVRKCATRYKYEHTIAAVNQAIVERLTRTGKKLLFKGASNVDWSTASEDSNTYEKIPRPMLARLGMHYGPHGLLVPGSPAPEVPGRVEEEGDEQTEQNRPTRRPQLPPEDAPTSRHKLRERFLVVFRRLLLRVR